MNISTSSPRLLARQLSIWLPLVFALTVPACSDNDRDHDTLQADMAVQKLVASDGAPDDRFGSSVAVDGDTIMIGADMVGTFDGAVYVFTRGPTGTWSEQQKLAPSEGAYPNFFGAAIVLEGDTAIVGAPESAGDRSDYPGSAYVFTRGVDGLWTLQQQLQASDGRYQEMFGNAVDLDGDTAVIAAWFADGYLGGVYVFVRGPDGIWTERQKLVNADFETTEAFGSSVAISGNTLMIGAQGNAPDRPNSVYAYAVDAQGVWTEQQTIAARGDVVDLVGDTAIIGHSGSSSAGDNSGAAYLFTRDLGGVWTEQQELTASDAAAGHRFGLSVALNGGIAVIGAPFHTGNSERAGAAYIFARGSGDRWTEQQKLTPDDGTEMDGFGHSVALEGSTAVIAARESVYVYEFAADVQIKIADSLSTLNGKSEWVAVLSDVDALSAFDPVSTVDISTIVYGPGRVLPEGFRVADINDDGIGDLLLKFRTTGMDRACINSGLTARTYDGATVMGRCRVPAAQNR